MYKSPHEWRRENVHLRNEIKNLRHQVVICEAQRKDFVRALSAVSHGQPYMEISYVLLDLDNILDAFVAPIREDRVMRIIFQRGHPNTYE